MAAALPANLKSAATQQMTDLLNNIVADPLVAEQVRNNFVSYAWVLKEGRFKTEDYIHAVTYVSFKVMGLSNQEAYEKTFPARMNALIQKGTSKKDIGAHVASYAKGRLVNMVLEQTLVPTWVLNNDLFQKALNVQADLMMSANSEKVRSDAANSILTHLKKPEAKGLEINLDLRETSGMNELKSALTKMAEQQQELIGLGLTPKQIAAQPIIEAEAKVV
jgi:hypothetical protein